MRFDESDLRLQILEQNTEQLQFDFIGAADTETSTVATPVLHPVITHFGSPEAVFDHAMIGAPYKTADGGCEWSWIEPFEQTTDPAVDTQDAETDADDTIADGFELRLRDEDQAGEDDEASEGEA